jgi:transcription elongation GreA/GreB family factor
VRELAALLQAAPPGEAAAAAVSIAADPVPLRSVEAGAAFELDWLLASTSGADPSTVLRGRTDPSPGRALQALSEISAPRCRRLYLDLWAASSGTPELEELLPQLGHSQRQMLLEAAGVSHPGWPDECLERLAGSSEDPDLRLWAASMLLEKAGDDDPDAGRLVRTLLETLPRGRAESQRRAARALVETAGILRSHLAMLDRRRLTQLSVQLGDIGQVHESGLFLEIGRELSGRSTETAAGRAFWESDYVFDDPSAIRRRAEAIDQLRTVEIPAAAAAVGEAASHGDLSENAEYKAALERRDLLLERLSRWTEEYDRLRPYPAADLVTSVSSPGTSVLLAGPGGEIGITLTGPLEARPEDGRVNYLAPLGRVLLGRTVGEELELPGREGVFRVTAIELAPGSRA